MERRLNKDSHNSHKPPSSDGFSRKPKPPKSLRPVTGKPSGAQAGHPGETLRQVETPDECRAYVPSACQQCGTSLNGVEPSAIERRQVFDLPKLALLVTEHQVQSLNCPRCHATTKAAFPEGVTQPTQYGPDIRALLLYLNTYRALGFARALLPSHRTTELVRDLFGQAPSEGTLSNAVEAASNRLAPVEASIRQAIGQSSVVHFDETGIRTEGKLRWLHLALLSQNRISLKHGLFRCFSWAEEWGERTLNGSA